MARFLYLYAGMLILASFLASVTECPSLFRLPPHWETLWLSIGIALLMTFVVVQGGKLLERLPWYRGMAELLKRMLTSPELLGPHLDSQKAFVIALYSGVGEEALFRGFVQPWLIQLFEGWLDQPQALAPTVLGVIVASVVFGVLHFPVVKELRPWTIFAIVAGLLLGSLAAWSQCLLGPILAHFLINWLNLKHLADMPLSEETTLPPIPPEIASLSEDLSRDKGQAPEAPSEGEQE